MASKTLLSQLASEITSAAKILSEYIESNNLPHPSFDADGPLVSVPGHDEKISAARAALIDATKALHTLAIGPAETIRASYYVEFSLLSTLQVLCHYNVPQSVPLKGTIAISELASKTKLHEPLLLRFLRMATANYYFSEPQPEVIAHTAWSKPLATDAGMRACIGVKCTDIMPAFTKLTEMVEAYPETSEPQDKDLAYHLAFGDTFFGYKEKHPDRMVKFGQFLDARTRGDSSQVDSGGSIARAYPWGELPPGSLVVDVGGGIGHISAAIAQEHPQLKFQVQDFARYTSEAIALFTARGVSNRAEHVAHNFFEAQPVMGAAVYFLRNILHNWSDVRCRKILERIVGVMGPDSRVVICDTVVPAPNTLLKTEEAEIRTMDLNMLALVNGKQRSFDDWEALFRSVDSRLYVSSIIGKPRMRRESLVEVRMR